MLTMMIWPGQRHGHVHAGHDWPLFGPCPCGPCPCSPCGPCPCGPLAMRAMSMRAMSMRSMRPHFHSAPLSINLCGATELNSRASAPSKEYFSGLLHQSCTNRTGTNREPVRNEPARIAQILKMIPARGPQRMFLGNLCCAIVST